MDDSDSNCSAAGTNDAPGLPAPEIEVDPPSSCPAVIGALRRWTRRLIVCNPFYLLSAALLLLGVVRLSNSPRFLVGEVSTLLFSFSALQTYEVLLVALIVFLGRRGIAYDSTLLVMIESILVFVPFILMTHSATIQHSMTVVLGVVAISMACFRYGIIKQLVRELRLPGMLLLTGAVLLIGNAALPFSFRRVIENGIDRWAPAYFWGWNVLLPLAVLMGNLLPRPDSRGGPASGRSWISLMIFGLWIAASATHFYCVGYVSEMEFEYALLTPLLWASIWTVYHRLTDFAPRETPYLERTCFVIATALPLLGLGETPAVSRVLMLANGCILCLRYVRQSRDEFTLQLVMSNVAFLISTLPQWFFAQGGLVLERTEVMMVTVALYILLHTFRFPRPELALVGMATLILLITGYGGRMLLNVALQTGASFFIVHSLFWRDPQAARRLRGAVAIIWVSHAVLYNLPPSGESVWVVNIGALIVLTAYASARVWQGRWQSWTIPASAGASLLAAPGHYLVASARAAPSGLVALLASFGLLVLGTLSALRKHQIERIRSQTVRAAETPD